MRANPHRQPCPQDAPAINLDNIIISDKSMMMDKSIHNRSVSFVEVFASTSIHPSLTLLQSCPSSPQFLIDPISNIWIDLLPNPSQLPEHTHHLPLNHKYALFLSRSASKDCVSKIALLDQPIEGWQPVEYPKAIEKDTPAKIYVQKTVCLPGTEHVQQIGIQQYKKQKSQLEITEPTLNQQEDNKVHEFFLEEFGAVLVAKTTKASVENCESLAFKAASEPLFKNTQIESGEEDVDLQTLSMLCYPRGLRVHKKPSGFKTYSFILTLKNGERMFCHSLEFREKCPSMLQLQLAKKMNFLSLKDLYVEKTFSLISEYECTDQIHLCMEALYKSYLCLEEGQFVKLVGNLPSFFTKQSNSQICRFESKFCDAGWKLNSSYPKTSTHSIYCMFKFLSIHNIIEVLEAILLESKIFFVSDSKAVLGYAIEAFLSFIFPLRWVHVIISLLPEQQLELVEAPMTTIFGINACQAERIEKSVEGFYVYLDGNRVADMREEKMPKMPKTLRCGLIKKLSRFEVYDEVDARDYLKNPEDMSLFKTQKTEDPHFDAYTVRNVFLELMIALMKDYSLHFIEEPHQRDDDQRKSFKKFYDIDGLKKAHKGQKFLCEFFECTLFTEFVECKYSEPSNKWIKFFDRSCRKFFQLSKRKLIQEESDYVESEEEYVEEKPYKGCLGLISMFSRQSAEDKSSPTKERVSVEMKVEEKEEKMESPEKKERATDEGHSETTEEFNEKDVEANMKKIKYEEPVEGSEREICFYFSIPYRKISSSRVGKKISQRMRNLKNWFFQAKQKDGQLESELRQ